MDEMVRRIAVTQAHAPLARRLVERLRESPRVDHVHAVVAHEREAELAPAGAAVLPHAPDARAFAEFLEKESIDTVVQGVLSPGRSGLHEREAAADVIGTMCLAGAVGQPGSPVRSWVIASSSAIYPLDSHGPLLHRETESIRSAGTPTDAVPQDAPALASTILEAEDYARDAARRLPHVNVALLRLQQLAGPGVTGPLAALLARDRVPVPIGFDPAVQLLHVDDAVDALAFAIRAELAGVYNVASRGVTRWHEAAAAAGRRTAPVLPIGARTLDPILAGLGIPHLPSDTVDLLRFGHAVDTRKLELMGWRAAWDQRSIFEQRGA